MVCLPEFSGHKAVIFAKNSDREPTEAQAIAILPRRRHAPGILKTTYIGVPQVAETFACILSRPFQMWGAEMGVNECGLAIGNEAVFTKVPINKRKLGLTGMDMLRLALERMPTARQAKDFIIELLETYGQDACGGYRNRSFYYHNSFIIADPQEAFLLETAGRHWAVQHVEEFCTISNILTIGEHFEEISCQAMPRHAAKIHFAKTYNDWLRTTIGRGAKRRACIKDWISARRGKLAPTDFFEILSVHHLPVGTFSPRRANTADICMHATGLLNPSDTTGSMVAALPVNGMPEVWVTGTSHPCMSVFFPVFIGLDICKDWLEPSSASDQSLWWTAKRAHQHVFRHQKQLMLRYQQERMALQKQVLLDYEATMNSHKQDPAAQVALSRTCIQHLLAFYTHWASVSA